MTLGEHLRRCRLDLGLTQRILAERLGVREETVHTWETGRVRPLPKHHGRLIGLLGYDPAPAAQELAGRIRATRLRLGLSQAEFARLTGLDEGSVCRWESGRRAPSRWMAERVEAILDRLRASPR